MRRIAAIIVLLPAVSSAQGVVGGIARDRASGHPLACMQVTLEDSAHVVAENWTRRDGTFEFAAPPAGRYTFKFKAFGFQPVESAPLALDPRSDLEREFRVDLLVEDSLLKQRHDTVGRSMPLPKPRESNGTWRYPDRLRRRAIYSGNVLVAHAVDEGGRVDTATIVNIFASEPEFFQAARDLLRTMRYRPAERAGAPACTLIASPLTFSAHSRIVFP